MILVYSAVLSAYVYKYVALHIRRCLRCVPSILRYYLGTGSIQSIITETEYTSLLSRVQNSTGYGPIVTRSDRRTSKTLDLILSHQTRNEHINQTRPTLFVYFYYSSCRRKNPSPLQPPPSRKHFSKPTPFTPPSPLLVQTTFSPAKSSTNSNLITKNGVKT